jgi:arylsulfatase A-like enzyme
MNIILLISDTFRYDNLFDRASMPVRTPELDRFAQRAVSCSRAYAASFPTVNHRTDLTSGRYGWPFYDWQDLRLSTKNHIPLMLRPAGYASQLLCDCPHLFNTGFNTGFDGAYALRGQEGDTYFLRRNHPIEQVLPHGKTRPSDRPDRRTLADLARWTNRLWYREEDRFPPRTARLAVEWLEENYRHHPFFLWVDFFDPHEPWDPPEYMVRRYDPDYTGTPMISPNYGSASEYAPAELRNLRAHYCADAELADRWIGRVLQKIDDLELWDNSVVVFTSDHGMSLGEHNRTGKCHVLPKIEGWRTLCWVTYPEIAHVPLMIAAPDLEGGRTVDAIVQPPDILPTLLDLAGVEVDPPEPFHGRSFAPMLRGEPQEMLHEFAVTSACLLRPDRSAPPVNITTPMLYTDRWAYAPIGADGRPELFDLDVDPYAERSVAGEQPKVIRELHGRLVAWLREMDAPRETLAWFE